MTVDVLQKLLTMLGEIQERMRLRRRRSSQRSVSTDPPNIASDALRALGSGTITVEDYVAIKIEQALAPLESLIAPAQLELVRAVLSENVRTDPVMNGIIDNLRQLLASHGLAPPRDGSPP